MSARPTLTDRRPYPLFVQGAAFGAALALLPVAIACLVMADEVPSGVKTVFSIVIVSTVFVLVAAVWAFVPRPLPERTAAAAPTPRVPVVSDTPSRALVLVHVEGRRSV